MSLKTPARIAEQTTGNIDLAFRYVEEAIADPESLDQIPNDATLVLLPYDDPTFALNNLALAMRLASKGQPVYVRRIGAPKSARNESLPAPHLAAYWDRDAGLRLEHKPDVGVLTVDFSDGPRNSIRFPIADGVALLIDQDTHEVVGYTIPGPLPEQSRNALRKTERTPGEYRLPAGSADAYAAFAVDLAPRPG